MIFPVWPSKHQIIQLENTNRPYCRLLIENSFFKKSNHIYQQLSSEETVRYKVNTLSGKIQAHVGKRLEGEMVESKLNGQRDHIVHKTKVKFPVLGELLPRYNQ